MRYLFVFLMMLVSFAPCSAGDTGTGTPAQVGGLDFGERQAWALWGNVFVRVGGTDEQATLFLCDFVDQITRARVHGFPRARLSSLLRMDAGKRAKACLMMAWYKKDKAKRMALLDEGTIWRDLWQKLADY